MSFTVTKTEQLQLCVLSIDPKKILILICSCLPINVTDIPHHVLSFI